VLVNRDVYQMGGSRCLSLHSFRTFSDGGASGNAQLYINVLNIHSWTYPSHAFLKSSSTDQFKSLMICTGGRFMLVESWKAVRKILYQYIAYAK